MQLNRIAVLGGGAWGTALAEASVRAGRKVTLWEQDKCNRTFLIEERRSKFLPDFKISDTINVTDELALAGQADAILLAMPAQAIRSVVTALAPYLSLSTPVVACAKGIEHGTNSFMTEIVAECAPRSTPAILSGPSFATDVARGLPTAVTLACGDATRAEQLAHAFFSTTFRPYHTTDVRGVEIGGAAKNVIAIAAGIVTGCRFGASAQAAIIARGFAEVMRFAKAFGARPETLMGLSGLGDLTLTCSTPQSRNFSFGVDLANGVAPNLAGEGKLSEGSITAPVLVEMARNKGVEMPISVAIVAVLMGQETVKQAIERLLSRPLKGE
jgi:glycerol-3-phosphate dehydrogenase (NAD(P)+)